MIRVRHSIPGRLRLSIRALRHNRPLADALSAALMQVEGVVRIRINPVCGALIVDWQRDRPLREEIEARLCPLLGEPIPHASPSGRRWRQQGALGPAGADRDADSVACRACRQTGSSHQRTRGMRHPWFWRLLGFAFLTGYLGFLLVRDYLLKRPVASGALSPTGVIALVAALPLLRDAWHETSVEKRFTLHQFLAFSLLLAIGFGEAATAFEIIYVLNGGRLLERFVAERSRRAIRDMLALSIKDAWVLVDGSELHLPVAELTAGALVMIRSSEKIPVDGCIEDGQAEVSEAVITGRAEPVFKALGDRVYAGSYLEQGVLRVRAESVGEQTYLARIAALVDAALDQKAPLQRRADLLAARLLTLGSLLTLATFILTRSLSRAFTVMLVMSCPCSTVLAASTAVSAAIHSAARRQILIKGGTALEQVGQARIWCFDKTGTLTTEEPEVAEVVAEDERALMHWAGSAEWHNPHALAHAIVNHAQALGVALQPHSESEHILGHGVRAEVDGSQVLLGNARLLAEQGIEPGPFTEAAERLRARGLTRVYVALDGELQGLLGIRHRLRSGAREAIARLRADGVERILLISGDERSVAEGLSRELGLDACYAELLPEDKAEVVRRLRGEYDTGGTGPASGRTRASGGIVMIGDGVNDALALCEADVGIAMGAGGSEVAIEVADIALADSDIEKLVTLHALSRATLRRADQNYALAVGTDLIGIGFGALGRLSPAMGGMIHILHTLGILANSSRLLAFRPPRSASSTDPPLPPAPS
ncbi:heavy metal translocating P-type ATPase [Halochromatium salexigens]|uniref:P-type Zn(2+) transporter n=1 Tax=Halochromatium salexigens TaxID=49447 RepID=A0AAJ0XF98_HALSE|nr:cation-translocating P-type ATPase [Halochromatium salexigens]MBK5930779.1 heavy metal translocating P-type ATPase [Halochromatium salexigens]